MKFSFLSLSSSLMHVTLCFYSAAMANGPGGGAVPHWKDYTGPQAQHLSYSLCGVTSVYVVAREFGIDCNYQQIVAQLKPGIYGNTMRQLVDCFDADPRLTAVPARCIAKDLHRKLSKNRECKAVLNLNDHWVVARNVTHDAFEIIDFPSRYFMPVDAVDSLWDGYAIVVRRRSLPIRPILTLAIPFLAISAVLAIALVRRMVHPTHHSSIP
ncbi:MAG TPA: cysteine peptidase family C39 domain-containing protein [Sedimentisphaerales bacterium]|nr:cysteine peptidase family C39 domain-containing protein [Sedimentisphaerales bacterium]